MYAKTESKAKTKARTTYTLAEVAELMGAPEPWMISRSIYRLACGGKYTVSIDAQGRQVYDAAPVVEVSHDLRDDSEYRQYVTLIHLIYHTINRDNIPIDDPRAYAEAVAYTLTYDPGRGRRCTLAGMHTLGVRLGYYCLGDCPGVMTYDPDIEEYGCDTCGGYYHYDTVHSEAEPAMDDKPIPADTSLAYKLSASKILWGGRVKAALQD